MPIARLYFWSAVAFMLLLLLATHASAAPFTRELDYAYELANEHWGGPPTDCSSIDFEIVDEGALGEGIEAWATVAPSDHAIPCVLWVVRKLASPNFFPRACAVLRHEDGHLHGLEHSSDPHNIMYPSLTYIPSQCTRAGLFLMNHPHYPQRRFA